MPVIEWENRFHRALRGSNILVSIDGVDFRIMEPSPFNPKWYSHKFHGPGLRYELAICIRTGDIVWAYGGLPCGEWSDLRLARDVFIFGLREGEKAIADRGYNDPNFFDFPNGNNDGKKKQVLARHETLNRRLKQFDCLQQRFRHDLYLHPLYFHSVVNLTQMMIDHGETLYSVDF
ncbi:hypothetical protein OUZ56_016043 [Daphnia magna]|nr:hypothetical protein OUZ56_016043 [Daphnia magna]